MSYKKSLIPIFIALTILLVIITVFPSLFNASGETFLEVHYLDVGQGDSVFIRTPGGKTILVDGGERNQGSYVTKYLQELGVNRLDLVVATHPHSDHIGGLIHVLGNLPVHQLITSPASHTSNTFFDFLSIIDEKEIPLSLPPIDELHEIEEDLFLHFLSPRHPFSNDLNDLSVVMQLHYRNHTFLFTGDLERGGESHLLQHYSEEILTSQVLKVGHHGSRTSSSEAFLRAVKPEIAVISCGIDNSYGHPHQEVIERLLSYTQGVFRTDLQGTILIISNGAELWSPSEPAHTPVFQNSLILLPFHLAVNEESY